MSRSPKATRSKPLATRPCWGSLRTRRRNRPPLSQGAPPRGRLQSRRICGSRRSPSIWRRSWSARRERWAWCSKPKLNLVPLPKAKAVMVIVVRGLLESLSAAPVILRHKPSAVEVMDKSILDHTRQNAALDRIRSTVHRRRSGGHAVRRNLRGSKGRSAAAPAGARRRSARRSDSATTTATKPNPPAQARIWSLREAALGLSMAMKDDAKSISFVEDTAVRSGKIERVHRTVSRNCCAGTEPPPEFTRTLRWVVCTCGR